MRSANLTDTLLNNWLDSLVVERMQDKSEMILRIFSETGNDWEETFYRVLSRYFGFRVNTEPFEMLAMALPFRIIRKHSDNRFQIESLLYGTSGMLQEGLFREAVADQYYNDLIREYKILSAKYSLQPLHGWIWKFSRLRPSNFPTIRISQLAAMLSVTGGLFSKLLEVKDIRQLKELFEVSASRYWDDHFVFGSLKEGKPKRTGSQATDIFLINAVIPLLFVYGRSRGLSEYSERALSLLSQIKSEQNSIISEWAVVGIKAESALVHRHLYSSGINIAEKDAASIAGSGISLSVPE